jgi:hypothetical protein
MECYKCKGRGITRDPINWLCGLFTLGMTILIDLSNWHKCDVCDGKGGTL